MVEALGQIGYPQALPYLLQLREKADVPVEVQAVEQAIGALRQERGAGVAGTTTSAEAFYRLAKAYYDDTPSLAADPRLDTANVWYWRDDLLQNIEVPTQIFNEIMCMRCCEEALRADPDRKQAQALWVAANFRREAQLGEDQVDRTRPADYPSAAYFAQTAGPSVCLMALGQALDDGDPAVALGAIEALRKTAGPASIVSDSAGRLPLAEAVSFPDRMVRIRAALTLGRAWPTEPFQNYQNIMPVFSEALRLHSGARSALVVDPDEEGGNQVAGTLRTEGYEVLSDTEFFRGLQKVREAFPALDVVFMASDLADADLRQALGQLRDEFRFAATPVIIISKPGDRALVEELVRADHRLGEIRPGAEADEIGAAVATVSHSVGVAPITPAVGTAIALEAAETLRLLAVSRNPLFSVVDARPALVAALETSDRELRTAVARVLVYICEPEAQEVLAKIALDEGEEEAARVEMFGLLAEAAKHCGNLLGEAPLSRIIVIAEQDENMVIRTAASQTLGALNLPADKGSEIIRNQYGG
jgi:CheY-like chemotaxis protein